MAKGFKVKPIHVAAILLLTLLVNEMGIVALFPRISTFYPGQVVPPIGPQPPPPPPVTPTKDAAKLEFTVQDYVQNTAITTTNTKADVSKAAKDGTLDLMIKAEAITVDSGPEQSAQTYSEGDLVVIHVSSDVNPTGGTDYYDRSFYATLKVNEPVRLLTSDILSVVQTSPTYKYKIVGVGAETGYTVQYTSGTTNYWGLGALAVIPRSSSANLDTYAMYGGTTLSSVTDGSTWDTTAGAANALLATNDEKVWIKIDCGATNIAYASPMYTLSSVGKLEKRVAVVIVTTTMTSIGTQKLYDKGWVSVQDSTLTAEKGFYKVISPQIPLKGNKWTLDIEMPIDSSAATASTNYTFKIWVIDFQLEDNVRIGSVSSSVPTAYGMIGEFGLDAMIHARAYATSAGSGTTQVLTFVVGTPA